MWRQQRFGLVALAVVVAVAAFLIARPDDEDEPADTGDSAPAQARTAPAETGPAGTQPSEAQPVEPVTRVRVEGGEPVGGIEEIEVERGETALLTVTSDSPQEVHIHGYDLIGDVVPGSPAQFRFEAEAEGVFEIELEGSHTKIAELRVVP